MNCFSVSDFLYLYAKKRENVLMAKGKKENRLQFVFKEKSFIVDRVNAEINVNDRVYRDAFIDNKYETLYNLAFEEDGEGEHATFVFLRKLSKKFIDELTDIPGLELYREKAKVSLSDEVADEILRIVPFGIGTEYITKQWIEDEFHELNSIYASEIANYEGTVQLYLTEKNQELRVPERIFFHLVDYFEDSYPFAFLATYATEVEKGVVEHKHLSYALTEYKDDRKKLLSLLSCLNKAAEVSGLVKEFVESGEMFHPLRLTQEEAYQLLQSIEAIEECGILCRVPNWWKQKKQRVSISVNVGEKEPSFVGFDALIAMVPSLAVDGEMLSQEEVDLLLEQAEGLRRIKGKWAEINHKKLKELLELMEEYQGDLSLVEALRLQSGMEVTEAEDEDEDKVPEITNGQWLGDLMNKLRDPHAIKDEKVPSTVQATLREYQEVGYNWLWYMRQLGFGACLADDMGLGKTLQVLTFLERLRSENKEAKNLLIVPLTLIGNWESEVKKFTPGIEIKIFHGKKAELLDEEVRKDRVFLNITTYQTARRIEALKEIEWDCLILDEAQAIKNTNTKQTKAVKQIKARYKIAMTGTPIENGLINLWSLFDFLDKGLLGTLTEFKRFVSRLDSNPEGYQRVKKVVAPFILRRLKTDKSIIKDLPEKIEQVQYVGLSKEQRTLYRKQIENIEQGIIGGDVINRNKTILTTLMELKQICNHPDHFLKRNDYDEKKSGKFGMLRDICETIYEKRERVLVFTYFKKIAEPLAEYLEDIFGCKGVVLTGDVNPNKREELKEKLNGEEYVPFMVATLKVAGLGLNLTAANHVILFDRWWNPAVENQAIDRAYRIGQIKNVFVYKFVCKGTIEEKINEMIESKKELAENIVGTGEEWITKLDDEEIMNAFSLE